MISSRLNDALNQIFNLKSSSRLKSFEGLRAFAIILVFNVHFFGGFVNKHYFVQENSFAEIVFEVLHSGYLGVDLFFVLSGFLIFSTLYRNKPTLRSYIGHRMIRILPAHVAVLIILTSLSNNAVNISEFCSIVFFLPAFFQNIPNYNFVTWTLGWEWLFYLLMFGLFYAGNALCIYAGMIFSLLLMFIGTFFFNSILSQLPITLPDPGRFAGFYVGVIVAHLVIAKPKNMAAFVKLPFLVPIVIIAVLASMVLWSVYISEIYSSYWLRNLYFLSGATFFGVIIAYLAIHNSGGIINLALQSKFMRIIGQISFSFYLVHVFIALPLARYIIGGVNSFHMMCAYYVLSFTFATLIATVIFYIFERPYFLAKQFKSKFNLWPVSAAKQK